MRQIGIPRALFYFDYFPLWQKFFEELGLEVVASPPTNKEILHWGLSTCVDGACLAMKSYVGHCQALAKQGVELLFVPQIISVYRREYTCPNFLGLPDLIRQYLPASIHLESPILDGRKGERALTRGYLQAGRKYASNSQVKKAWQEALEAQKNFELANRRNLNAPSKKKLTILFLGPRYLTDDSFLNGNLKARLEKLGANALTAQQLADSITFQASSVLAKRPFWTGARRSIGALEFLMKRLDGVVSIAPFGCGAESMLGTLIERQVRNQGIAHLELNIDEHTSEVGLITRLEAFCDLLERKKSG